MTVRGGGSPLADDDLARIRDAFNRTAFVSFIGLEDEASDRIGFTVDRPTEVEIYALGEAIDESTYDYGWILNTDTRETVWRFERRRSDHAGGAEKNRMFRLTTTLPAGSYAALVATDDSHDAWDWNAAPPYDPAFWGLTVRVTDPSDRDRINTFEYEPTPPQNVIVDLTQLGDREAVREGFTLTERMDVRVYAVGEGSGGDMYDYGWIVDAETRQPVWEMEYYRTDHAGGAEKNRVVDEVVNLDAGNYIVYFVTDGSHSYFDWNSAPPVFDETWGITVLGAGGYNRNAVRAYDERSDPSVIVQLIGIRDHDRRRERFTLDRDTDVRIYALGEGIDNRMYDYAWIENARTRRTVWEMEYRDTERAGGARKNRLFTDTISLPAGEYILQYESDGSHSFGDWNSAPPADAFNYGVTLFRLQGGR